MVVIDDIEADRDREQARREFLQGLAAEAENGGNNEANEAELLRRRLLRLAFFTVIMAVMGLFACMIYVIVSFTNLFTCGICYPSQAFNDPRHLLFFAGSILSLCLSASTILIIAIKSVSKPYSTKNDDSENSVESIINEVPIVNATKGVWEIFSNFGSDVATKVKSIFS